MINEILSETKHDMEKAIKSLSHEFASLRTGRASLSLLDSIKVEYYGSVVPLNQVASLGIPEPRLITISPWESRLIPVIEKAILVSGLGLNPSNDGKIIRLPIPPLTEERRRDLVRLVRKLAEEGRVAIRNIRRDTLEMLKDAEKEGEISEDDNERAKEELQKVTDRFIEQVNDLLKTKETEIMAV
jgi:ribosome recycling factor